MTFTSIATCFSWNEEVLPAYPNLPTALQLIFTFIPWYNHPWPTQITHETPGKYTALYIFQPLADGPVISSPWVILSDFGGAFSMGAVGGGIWYGIKGARNSPRVRFAYNQTCFCSN